MRYRRSVGRSLAGAPVSLEESLRPVLQPRYPAARPVERGYLRLPHGDLHYRAAGQGPLVLALHESPRSSLSLLPVIDALAGRYRVVAPDTPGYGLSDPLLGDAPAMDAFLDAIAATLDALGARTAAFYGAHTGAALATAFARREPGRVSALVLDGLSAFTDDEVEDFRTRYLAPYLPDWDGRHVMGLWSRVKDHSTWFPWYERTPARRLRRAPSDLEPLQRSALGFVQSGPHYAKAYIRAAAFQPNAVLRDLKPPVTVMARPTDLIADHLDRLEPGPGWDIVWLDESAAAWSGAIRHGVAKGRAPDAAAPGPPPGAQTRPGARFVPVGEGWLHMRMTGRATGPVRVVLPGLPGDVEALAAAQAAAHPEDLVVVISPPGCGASDPLADAGTGLDGVVAVLEAALAHLALEPSSLAGEGASAVVARVWAHARGGPPVEYLEPLAWMAPGAILPTAPLLRAEAPRWDGAHLTSAWFQLRDLQLYDVPPGAGAPVRVRGSDSPDVARLDRLFRAYVQGPDCADLLGRVIDHLRVRPGDGVPEG